MKRKILKITSIILSVSILMCACGKKAENKEAVNDNNPVVQNMNTPLIDHNKAASTVLFETENHKVTVEEFYIYLFMYFSLNNINPDDITDVQKTNIINTILDQLKLETAEYEWALAMDDVEITDEDKTTANDNAAKFYDTYGEVRMQYFGISKEAIEEYFIRQAYIAVLIEKTYKELTEGYYNDYLEEYKDTKFFKLYYVLFPALKYDENNNPVLDASGNYTYLNEDEMKEQEAKANELREKALENIANGFEDGKMEDLAVEYGVEFASGEQQEAFGAYDESLNSAIEDLEEGAVSEVVAGDFGYMIIRMDNRDDEKAKLARLYSLAYNNASSFYPTMQKQWVETSGVLNCQIDNNELNRLEVKAVCAALTKE